MPFVQVPNTYNSLVVTYLQMTKWLWCHREHYLAYQSIISIAAREEPTREGGGGGQMLEIDQKKVTLSADWCHVMLHSLHVCAFLQVNLYLLSRILLGLVKVAVKKGILPEPNFPIFPLFAGLMWGIVLCLFEYQQETLQQSLQNSMTYIYHDSLVWNNIWDFLVYNSDILW
jgi:hypothetical protein